MSELLFFAAAFLAGTVAVGLIRILLGPTDADRMMSAQLLGTGGIAALLLLATASGNPAILDVALCVGLLAAFAGVVFFLAASQGGGPDRAEDP
ncbi:MAG: multiple resistance and pH regulation protein F [Rhodospirillales bacterium]|nr:multiple resistance and pH regulation protein F [Rhodospirillales bacterium]